MTWVRLDDGFYRNRKARLAGKDGRALFLASCCYSAAALTDGHISRVDLPVLCADAEVKPSVAKRLVEVGLWHEVDDGWTIHGYLELNPSKEKVEADRAAAADRTRKWRDGKRDASRKGARNASSDASPSHPDPSPQGTESGTVSTSSSSSPPAEGGGDEPVEFNPAVKDAIRETRNGLRAVPIVPGPEGAKDCPCGNPWADCVPSCPELARALDERKAARA